jgi:hypothetical protein
VSDKKHYVKPDYFAGLSNFYHSTFFLFVKTNPAQSDFLFSKMNDFVRIYIIFLFGKIFGTSFFSKILFKNLFLCGDYLTLTFEERCTHKYV